MGRHLVLITMKDASNLAFEEDLISYECTESSKDSDLTLNPGVIEQSATVEIYDKNDRFKKAAMFDTINAFENASLVIYYVDDNNEYIQLGDYLISSIELNGDNDTVTINCYDITSQLNDIKIEQYAVADRTAHTLLSIIFNQFLNQTPWEYLDQETSNRCNWTVVYNSYMTNTNAREVLEMVCSLCMLTIFYKNGKFYVGSCL